MARFISMFLILLVTGAINSGLETYVKNQWVVVGPLLFLFLFLYLRPRLKCENCGYPTLRDSKGAWAIQARKFCSRCGLELKPFAVDTTQSGPRETIGFFLQMISVGGALFLVVVTGFQLAESDGLTLGNLIAFAIIVTPIALLLFGAWVYGSKLLLPKSK